MRKLKNVTLTLGLFMFVMGLSIRVQAQVAEKSWNYGAIVLNTGDTLVGVVKYTLKNSLIRIKEKGKRTVRAFTSKQVLFYQFYDPYLVKWRVFYSLPYSPNTSQRNDRHPYFYELVYKNKPFTIISRQALMATNELHWYLYELELFYLLDDKNRLIRVKKDKNSLLRALKKYRRAITKYMVKNKIKVIDRDAFINLVHYYNTLEAGNNSK